MKKCIPLFTLLLMAVSLVLNEVKAQECAIVNVQISSDSTCVSTIWLDGLDALVRANVATIELNDRSYGIFQEGGDTIGYPIRFVLLGSDSVSLCDTIDMVGFSGTVSYTFLGENSCEFADGEALPRCPDDVMVSMGEDCFLFVYNETVMNLPPDTLIFQDTNYLRQQFNPDNPLEILYLREGVTECDTINGILTPITDTINFGPQVCIYDDGVLPIVILAFDYRVDADQVQLTWKVNSDEPTERLYLQKSYDGVHWVSIHDQAMVQPYTGAFTTGTFSDQSVNHSKVYYRLFIKGLQGNGNYSNVLPVALADRKINNIFYQPQSRSIMIQAGRNFVGQMQLLNTHGQNMMTREVTLSEGGYVEVQVEGMLPSGIYFVRFEDGLMPPVKLFIQ